MKNLLLLITLLSGAVLVAGQHASHQASQPSSQQAEPQFKLVQFQMALMKRGPKALPAGGLPSALRKQHIDYVTSLLNADKAMIAGPVRDDAELLGVYIFR